MSDKPLHQVLDELAHRVGRLGQKRIDPEAFHVEKSDIAGELRAIARQLKADVRVRPSTVFHRTPADADPRARRAAQPVGIFKDL